MSRDIYQKALRLWLLATRVALAGTVVMIPCSIYQTPLWATALLGCAIVTLYRLHKRLERRNHEEPETHL